MCHDTVDLSTVAREVATSLEMGETERHFTFLITDGMKVNCDVSLLNIVLNNMIGNAWKYYRNRAGTVIAFRVTEIEREPAYFVRDNGPGFAMADTEKLFQLGN
jgi:K+-sensing histidine kinase KdpD